MNTARRQGQIISKVDFFSNNNINVGMGCKNNNNNGNDKNILESYNNQNYKNTNDSQGGKNKKDSEVDLDNQVRKLIGIHLSR